MSYNKILKSIAKKHRVSVKEVKKEMQHALLLSNINIPTKDFIKITSQEIKKTIYSKSYNL
jgi:signal recognition particle GTPase